MNWQTTRLASTFCILALLATNWLGFAPQSTPDVVIIPPTPVSSDPYEQLLNSMATLNAFQQAIDQAPEAGRTIQLEPGVYDFSAVVILDPEDLNNPPENYSVDLDGAFYYFNPHALSDGYSWGVAILGRNNLKIRGAPLSDTKPTTVIRGCSDPRCLDAWAPQAWSNYAITIGGDYEKPSRHVVVENIEFEYFYGGVTLVSHAPYHDWFSTDPRFGTGTEDTLIQNNTFTNVLENWIGRKQLRPVVRGNHFAWTIPVEFSALHLVFLGLPNEHHPVDALAEDNTFEGGDGAIRLLDRLEGITVRHNTIRSPDENIGIVVAAGTHGVILPAIPSERAVIEGNSIDGGYGGIGVFGSGWEIRGNTVKNALFGIWTEWGGLDFQTLGILQPTVSEHNLIANNDLRSNVVGVYVSTFSRNNTYRGNNVEGNSFAGYYLIGPQEIWPGLLAGPASGNRIIGSTLHNGRVIDASGCYPGPVGCPQVDEDGDGLFGEDPVDNFNNDGDTLAGLALNDEDSNEEPNFITGMQAEYGPVTPPWASAANAGVNSLTDGLSRMLQNQRLCVDPRISGWCHK